MAFAVINPFFQFFDNAGEPLDGGTVETYESGTSTPKVTYQDATLSTPNSTTISLNSAGRCSIFVGDGETFKYILKDSSGVTIDTKDGVKSPAGTQAGIGALLYPRTSVEIAAGVTPTYDFYPPGDLRRYGNVGDGVTDDTAAMQRAFTVGGRLFSPAGMTYLVSSAITVAVNGTNLDLGRSTIKVSDDFDSSENLRPFNVSATDVQFSNGIFDATGVSARTEWNIFIRYISGAHRGKVHDCRFVSLPSGGADLQCAVSFLTGADDGEVYACTFNDCPGSVFSQGARVRIFQCTSTAPKDVSYALNSTNCIGGSIIGCKVYSGDTTVSGHIAIEEGASEFVVTDNYVYGVKNGFGIAEIRVAVTTGVNGGVIANNVIDGGGFTTTGASSLLSTSTHTTGVRIVNNILRRMPTGLAANTTMRIGARYTLVQGNKMDCTSGVSAVAAVVVTPGGGPLDFIDNHMDCTSGPTRHVAFDSGDNDGHRAYFKGGSFIGGSEGINTAINAPTDCPLWFENIAQFSVTTPINLDGNDSIEAFFSTYNAWRWPHSLKERRVCFGNAAPTLGTWSQGDVVYNLGITAGTSQGWVCVADGTPGTWKAMANVAA